MLIADNFNAFIFTSNDKRDQSAAHAITNADPYCEYGSSCEVVCMLMSARLITARDLQPVPMI